uniref:UDP-glycosyltransferases domain-containing protein n=1 Tax=Fagus sylvatica TaxID=28930 RepID=A0A2N9FKN0_FAGSY
MQAHVTRSVNIEIISDGSEDVKDLESLDEYLKRFKLSVSESLAKLIERLNNSKHPPRILVHDSLMPWALNVAQKLGLDGAPFFTQACVVNAIYYHAHQGAIQMPLEGSSISLPSMPSLEINDLPSILYDTGSYPDILNVVVNWMTSQWPIKTIGPAIPSTYQDERLEDDKEYGLNLFNPNVDICMKWLDSKETGPVVYTSFGSLAALGEEQMEELTWGLKNSNFYFLCVVRESEEKKLPNNFIEETVEKGLVALSLGVPMIALPQWTDQTTNAKFIVDVWKVGIRIKMNEKGIATKEEIEVCIRDVMGREKGEEIKRNSMRWKELAKETVDEGGSSDKNIEEFVAKLAQF